MVKIVVNKLLVILFDSVEVYNLNGIILVNDGEINKVEVVIEKLWFLFILDEIVMNNLVVIVMFDDCYSDVVRILLFDYLVGKRGSLMLYNLVFLLV